MFDVTCVLVLLDLLIGLQLTVAQRDKVFLKVGYVDSLWELHVFQVEDMGYAVFLGSEVLIFQGFHLSEIWEMLLVHDTIVFSLNLFFWYL